MKLKGFVRNATRFTEAHNKDCVVRGLATATGQPYNLIRECLVLEGRKSDNVGFDPEPMLVKYKYEMFGKQFTRVRTISPEGSYFCWNGGHAWAIIDGMLHDSINGGRRATHVFRVTSCPDSFATDELVARAKLKLALYDND